jgi:hypothetical protein
MGRALERAAQ